MLSAYQNRKLGFDILSKIRNTVRKLHCIVEVVRYVIEYPLNVYVCGEVDNTCDGTH